MFGNYSAPPRPLHAVVIAQSIPVESLPDFPSLYASYHPRLFRLAWHFPALYPGRRRRFKMLFSISSTTRRSLTQAGGALLPCCMEWFAIACAPLADQNVKRHWKRMELSMKNYWCILSGSSASPQSEGRSWGFQNLTAKSLSCAGWKFSYEDAASALEILLGTVRSRLNRAKQQLKLRFKEFEGGQG